MPLQILNNIFRNVFGWQKNLGLESLSGKLVKGSIISMISSKYGTKYTEIFVILSEWRQIFMLILVGCRFYLKNVGSLLD